MWPSFQAALGDPQQYGARFMGYLQDPEPWAPPAGVLTDEVTIDGPGGSLRLKVFRPVEPIGNAPALLWMHGGGFVTGSIDDTESAIPGCELAARAGAVVVSVDYRLSVNGVRYPAALDDTLAAWAWLGQQAAELGVDDGRLFVGGASVGAALATAAAAKLRDDHAPAPCGMLLAYPIVHFPVPPTGSALMRELEQLPAMLRFEPDFVVGTMLNYAGRVTNLPAGVAPGNFDLTSVPETWIAPAEYDELRASGELLALQLQESDVAVHLQVAPGMVHGFLGRGTSLAPVDAALDFFAGALHA